MLAIITMLQKLLLIIHKQQGLGRILISINDNYRMNEENKQFYKGLSHSKSQMGGFCLLVGLYREGSAPAACEAGFFIAIETFILR